MITFNLGQILLMVKNLEASVTFYTSIFTITPALQSPSYAMFILKNGLKLGLWASHDAQPTPTGAPGTSEICILVDNVDESYQQLKLKKLMFIQEPTNTDFGKTFVFTDPDGHRIRIYKLAQNI
jgi:predicted enzyme related to lactoylglutathione lyase